MRQVQQNNRRGRGRSRKSHNPMQRGYESNGPDVKIRGNAAHIAEKYVTLARDALSSGDTVMAENYLQHAEHYNRIIASAQSQQDGQAGQGHGQQNARSRNNGNDAEAETQPETATAGGDGAVKDSSAPEETKRPRRRPANGASRSAKANDDTAAAGPVKMGDLPADEAASS